MTEHVHPGPHLDPEVLNAFVEDVLPAHERRQCLSHFAECSRCREILFLAQPPQPVPEPLPSKAEPWWRRWFGPIPVLGSALAACALIMAVWFQHGNLSRREVAPPSAEWSAQGYTATASDPAQQAARAIAEKMRIIPSQAPPPPKASAAVPHRLPEAPSAASPAINTASTIEPAHTEPPPLPAAPSQQPAAGAARKQLLVPRAPEATFAAKRPVNEPTAAFATGAMPPGSASGGDLKLSVEHGQSTPNGLSEVKGSVADLSGAAVPGATVTVRPLAGSAGSTAKTGADGQFAINALPAGQYELQIESPGFQTASTQVELQPQDLAMVESKLSIGSTSESVEVTAASPVLSTERSASLSIQQAHPLPSKLPVVSSANNGLGIIAVDSAGTLFFRQSRRKQWEIVNPQWPGKATRVAVSPGSMVGQQFGQGKSSAALPPSSAVRPPVFHLYTDKGSAWFSQDGTHWYPELPKR